MSEKQLLELDGTVENIVFRNDKNGYSVLTLLCDGIAATAVGNMTDVNIGDELKLYGNWKVNPNYGEQFSFEYYEHEMPSSAESIFKYLASGAIKGIGIVMAKRIVNAFGDDTLEVMKNQPEKLEKIRGISHDKAVMISAEVSKIFGMREVMLYLEKYHITALESVRIWKVYGEQSTAVIEENPYALCAEEIAVPFTKADMIAEFMGRTSSDPCRIRAGIVYLISYNSGNGHTCLPLDKLTDAASKFLKIEQETIECTISELLSDATLVCDSFEDRNFVFLPSLYKSEYYCAERIKTLLQIPPERIPGGELALELIEKENNIEYAMMQKNAILEALSGGLLILTGGPGTGKTTTLNAIIKLYKQFGLKVMLAAPTGRAAQRMSELTGENAKTIHRLLEVEWDTGDRPRFSRNERNLLECDALIVDEMSMVDVSLLESLLRALPVGGRLIMVGDCDQLPSVGPGNVLGDLIESGKIPVVQLTEIFRQSLQSLIITNAHKIVHGEMPEIRRTDNDFFFIAENGREEISEKIVQLCTKRLPAAYG